MCCLTNILAVMLVISFSVSNFNIVYAQSSANDSGDELTHKDVATFMRCAGYRFTKDKEPPVHQNTLSDNVKSAKMYFDKAHSLASKENFTISENFANNELAIGIKIYELKDSDNSFRFENLCAFTFMAHMKD